MPDGGTSEAAGNELVDQILNVAAMHVAQAAGAESRQDVSVQPAFAIADARVGSSSALFLVGQQLGTECFAPRSSWRCRTVREYSMSPMPKWPMDT